MHPPVTMRLVVFVAAWALFLVGCSESSPQTKLKPGTQFRLHEIVAQAGPNTRTLKDPNSGAALNLNDSPFLTEANVMSATVGSDEHGIVYLDVEVDKPGADRLLAATAATGQQVAILVNGNIVSAPIIRAPISNRFRVTGSLTMSDWQNLVE